MRVDDLKEKLLHLANATHNEEAQQAVAVMLEALQIEATWTEEELEQYCKEVEELEQMLMQTDCH